MRTFNMFRPHILLFMLCYLPFAEAGEWTSSVAGEWLVFAEDAAFANQHNSYLSAAIETEYYHEWNGGNDLFTFKPFLRLDQHDTSRTHGDIRELSWLRAENDWEVLVGISKVFWGATEAVHLVDIVKSDRLRRKSGW